MFKNEFSTKPSRQRIMALGFLLGVSLVVYIYHPSTPVKMISSPFRQITGLYCPGCGTIRALTQLLQGNILKAISHNIFAVLFSPLLIWVILSNLSIVVRGKPLAKFELPSKYIWILLGTLIIFAIGRNIPLPQLDFIRP